MINCRAQIICYSAVLCFLTERRRSDTSDQYSELGKGFTAKSLIPTLSRHNERLGRFRENLAMQIFSYENENRTAAANDIERVSGRR